MAGEMLRLLYEMWKKLHHYQQKFLTETWIGWCDVRLSWGRYTISFFVPCCKYIRNYKPPTHTLLSPLFIQKICPIWNSFKQPFIDIEWYFRREIYADFCMVALSWYRYTLSPLHHTTFAKSLLLHFEWKKVFHFTFNWLVNFFFVETNLLQIFF